MGSDQRFVPRPGIAAAGDQALVFLNEHLTVISIVSAVLAVVVLIAGPVRLALVPTVTGPSSSGSTPVESENAIIGSSNPLLIGDVLNRELVPFTIIPDRPRDELVGYVVQPGDTLMGIAGQFGLDRNTLFWSNEDILRGDVHMLQPGVALNILPMDGVLHKSDGTMTLQQVADKYSVDVNTILEYEGNEMEGYTAATTPPYGKRIIVPGGTGEINTDAWKPPIQDVEDPVTGTRVSAFMPNMAGSCAAGLQGGGGTGSWVTPLPGAAFTQPYYPGHSGVDLAMPPGSPVQAADTGIVVFSGWVSADWGYGIIVVLDHGGGFTSYYAHLSSNSVRCGQTVTRGGIVGAVGSTGNSSGPHLHFELRWGHQPVDPAGYIGF
jgi:murein DD-endopeptidase MepM/ murein hydrolase activator NlpD